MKNLGWMDLLLAILLLAVLGMAVAMMVRSVACEKDKEGLGAVIGIVLPPCPVEEPR